MTSRRERPAQVSEDLRDLVFELGVGLHRAGASSAHLEGAISRCTERLGLKAEFFVTPTSVMLDLDGSVRLARVEPGDPDLTRLGLIDALLEDLEEGRVGVRQGVHRLRSIVNRRAAVPAWLDTLAAGVGSATAVIFFGGGLADVALAGALGVGVAVLGSAVAGSEHRRRLFGPLSALMVAATANVLAHLGLPIAPLVVTLAGLIVLVPGYSLTVALGEVAAGHLVSGTARLAGVGGTLLGMGLGVGVGQALGDRMGPTTAVPLEPLGPDYVWISVVSVAAAFTVLFRARWSDLPLILVATVLAFLGGRAGGELLGGELGGLVGALVLGLVGNASARITSRPASTVILPGMMVLVPGSIGFRAVSLFLESDPLSGVESAFAMAIVGSSLVGGLLAANVLLPPRRSL